MLIAIKFQAHIENTITAKFEKIGVQLTGDNSFINCIGAQIGIATISPSAVEPGSYRDGI